MIQIENLSKVFRTSEVETIALNHVNIEVKEGEFVAIMGPSGCGKSTLLSERKERVLEILKRMNLSHRAKHFPQQLSGGQQQRVAIARAVVTNPKLILADEPTGNLDSKNGAEVMNLLTELNKEGTSIVMVTHSQHDAGFAHRVIHLFDGSVVANIKE